MFYSFVLGLGEYGKVVKAHAHNINVFSFLSTLGLGEYGKVVKAHAHNINGVSGWSEVAVKMLREDADKKNKEALLVEMSIMKLVDPHQNIVKLLGCCIDAVSRTKEKVVHRTMNDQLPII